ncbi:MAG: outer membrane beta-barrel protein [Enterovibrio sp.]
MKIITKALMLASIVTAPGIFAKEGMFSYPYMGIGLSTISYNSQQGSATQIPDWDGNVNGFYFIAGLPINHYVDIEGRYGSGFTEDNYFFGNSVVNVDLARYYGLYGKFKLRLLNTLTPYATLGYTWGTLEVNSPLGGGQIKESGISYGVGLQVNILPVDVSIEYMEFMNDSRLSLSGFNLSFSKKF